LLISSIAVYIFYDNLVVNFILHDFLFEITYHYHHKGIHKSSFFIAKEIHNNTIWRKMKVAPKK